MPLLKKLKNCLFCCSPIQSADGTIKLSRKQKRQLNEQKKQEQEQRHLETNTSEFGEDSIQNDPEATKMEEMKQQQKRFGEKSTKVQALVRGHLGRKRAEKMWQKALEAATEYWMQKQRLHDLEILRRAQANAARKKVDLCSTFIRWQFLMKISNSLHCLHIYLVCGSIR